MKTAPFGESLPDGEYHREFGFLHNPIDPNGLGAFKRWDQNRGVWEHQASQITRGQAEQAEQHFFETEHNGRNPLNGA